MEERKFPQVLDRSNNYCYTYPKTKDHAEPTNYKPIALTSCVCKAIERMIDKRVVWYMEKNILISTYQTSSGKIEVLMTNW